MKAITWYRVIVTGSRDWTDIRAVRSVLERLLAEHGWLTVVHGDCPDGADAIAQAWCEEKIALAKCHDMDPGVVVERKPADWEGRGKIAGFLRNQEMADLGADECVAFARKCRKLECSPQPHASHGTGDMMRRARAAGITVRRITE